MTVRIVLYKWAGKKFFFKIKTVCEECNLTKAMLEDMMNRELKGKDVTFEEKPWLDNFFYCLFRRSWHAPIIMVNGKRFHQFSGKDPLVNRKKLVSYIIDLLKNK